jgi:acyl dehydratase
MSFSVGQEFASKSVKVNRALLVQYADASGDQNPIHQNEEFAKSVGLPDVIAHGMFTMGVAATYLSEIAGSAAVIEFSAKFIKPVVVPAGVDVAIDIYGKVTDVIDGIVKVELTVMCNEVKVLGNAKGAIKWPKS